MTLNWPSCFWGLWRGESDGREEGNGKRKERRKEER